MREKEILIVNDDGINSPGIRAALGAVKGLGNITIAAPATQQSGVGRSISLFEPIRVSEVQVPGCRAYSIAGTPVDAVIVAIYGILERTPDLLISGINVGENMSTEVSTSGTVCAAIEGASQGAVSFAVSQHASSEVKFIDNQPELEFGTAAGVTRAVAKHLLEEGMSAGVDLLNINVPEGVSGVKGARLTRLARRMYTTRTEKRRDPRGRSYFWIDGDAIVDEEEGTDVHAVRKERKVSITPLKLDFTAGRAAGELEGLAASVQDILYSSG